MIMYLISPYYFVHHICNNEHVLSQHPITFRTWSHGVRDYLCVTQIHVLIWFEKLIMIAYLNETHVYYHFYTTCLMNIIEAVSQNNHILCQICTVKICHFDTKYVVFLISLMWHTYSKHGVWKTTIGSSVYFVDEKHMNLLQMDLIICLFLGGVAYVFLTLVSNHF
jgi:hypothetical protein